MIYKMNSYEKKVRAYLKEQGLRNDLSGYQYLCDIILYLLVTPQRFVKKAMDEVAENNDTTYRNVQNSISYALKQSNTSLDCKSLVFSCLEHIREQEEEEA